MLKIKFNLNFGGEQIRTLDDLRENFSIEDVLDVYNNGLLVKWLDVRNYKNELEKVKAIQSSDARAILSELIKIFGVTSDSSEIEESLSVLDYLEGRKKFWDDIKAGKLDEVSQQQGKAKALQEYQEGYNALVQDIVDHSDDLHYIYDRLDEITEKYQELLKLNSANLFYHFVDKAPLAAFALFGDSATRPYCALSDDELRKCDTIYDYEYHGYSGNSRYYDYFLRIQNELIQWSDFKENRSLLSLRSKIDIANTLLKIRREVHHNVLANGDHSLEKEIFKGYLTKATINSYTRQWQQIEPQGKKYMIIIAHGCNILSAGKATFDPFDDYNQRDFNHDKQYAFPVYDGIQIVTGASGRKESSFYYMEAR